MAAQRDVAINDIEELITSVDAVKTQLKLAEEAYRIALKKLRNGESVKSTLEGAEAAEIRKSMTEALDRFEKRRGASRVSLIAAEVEEGSSLSSVSRTWGFSRQLVSRYVKQAEKDD